MQTSLYNGCTRSSADPIANETTINDENHKSINIYTNETITWAVVQMRS